MFWTGKKLDYCWTMTAMEMSQLKILIYYYFLPILATHENDFEMGWVMAKKLDSVWGCDMSMRFFVNHNCILLFLCSTTLEQVVALFVLEDFHCGNIELVLNSQAYRTPSHYCRIMESVNEINRILILDFRGNFKFQLTFFGVSSKSN